MTVDAVIPPCASLPLSSSTGIDAIGIGCVSSITAANAMVTSPHRREPVWNRPELVWSVP